MKLRQKLHYWGKKRIIQKKKWDLEFLADELKSMREGLRQEYDRLREQLDAAKRRRAGEKYSFCYSASGDEVSNQNIPILPDELEKLPDEPKDTKDFRFFKKPKKQVDETLIKNLENLIQKTTEDTQKLKMQMDGIDGQLDGPDGVYTKIEGYLTAMKMIDQFIKKN